MTRKMSRAAMNAKLAALEKPAIVTLILDMARNDPENHMFLESRFGAPTGRADHVQYCKKAIRGEFYPLRNGHPILRVAKNILSDYLRDTGDEDGALDLKIFYVELGTHFGLDYGDMTEAYYSSMVCVFEDVIKVLGRRANLRLVRKYLPRLQELVDRTQHIGWGYEFALQALLKDLKGGLPVKGARSGGVKD
jgi:hypothetical protein